MPKIKANEAFYIKLGREGVWEDECLKNGTIRFGYDETPRTLTEGSDWEAVREFWIERRSDKGAGKRDENQIRTFFTANEKTLFITFARGLMHWCFPCDPIRYIEGEGTCRPTVNGWHHESISGKTLTTDRLSGQLLTVQMFRGTICQVKPFKYLMRKLNDELLPELATAEDAEAALLKANLALIRHLSWQDFELLVDLLFSVSGWRRLGAPGKQQKTIDLEILLPSTSERAFVQIKSRATNNNLRKYEARFEESNVYDHMFFVWHTGTITAVPETGITLIGPEEVSRMVVEAGLSSWLREKVM